MRDQGLQAREEQGAPADEAGAARHEDERVDALQPQRVCVVEPLVQRGAERGLALNACAFRPQRRRVDGKVERTVGQILDVLPRPRWRCRGASLARSRRRATEEKGTTDAWKDHDQLGPRYRDDAVVGLTRSPVHPAGRVRAVQLGQPEAKDTQRAASPARLLPDSSTTLQLQRLTSEEAPPKRLRPLATSPTICCPLRLLAALRAE
eukprot:scaffold96651_cov65-Phaeocystis_antarctica.AAC.3